MVAFLPRIWYIEAMKAPTTPDYPVDHSALMRGYRRILALPAWQQALIATEILEDAKIWLTESITTVILDVNPPPRSRA